jgi:Ca-activated chloride channel family protein
MTPPDAGSWPDDRQPRDLILVLDKSGSMAGSAMDQAKTAAVTGISRLRETDRFNVILFDDDAHSFFRSARLATSENIENIMYGLDRVNGNGGTNLVGALIEAVRLRPERGRLRQIVFLTDGASSEDEQFLRLLGRRLHKNRLFTVGIGAASNSYLMVRAAQLGRGTYIYIDNASQIEERMEALFRKLEKPTLTDMKIAWGAGLGSAAETYPSRLPDLYIGEPVSFLVRISLAAPYLASMSLEPTGSKIVVSGFLKGERWHQTVDISNVKPVAGVAALWAREKVADLKNRLRFEREDEETLRRKIVPIALRYQLVTEYTSLVAVDRSTVARPPNSSLHRSEIKRNLPFGMDYENIWDQTVAPKMMHMAPVPSEFLQDISFQRAIGLPATASPAAERLFWGGVLLLLGLMVCAVAVFRRPSYTEATS